MRLRAAGALAAALAVGLGAFGAHGLKERLAALPPAAGGWETATRYRRVHAAPRQASPHVGRQRQRQRHARAHGKPH